MTREELLEKLYRTWWDDIATCESDDPKYSLITWIDACKMDDICEQIAALEEGNA